MSDYLPYLKYNKYNKLEKKSSLPRPATIDLALARPTLRVVLGSLRGGRGAGDLPNVPPMATLLLPLRGNVAYCL